MNKFIKTLIVINGILIPIIIAFVFINIIKDTAQYPTNNDTENGILVENLTENKNGDTIALQGISYQEPFRILETENYIMAITPKTYEEPKQMRKTVYALKSSIKFESDNYLNFIFLDKDFNCVGKLVNKKASIKDYLIPEENNEKQSNNVNYIAYLITFKDTNKDGVLNGLDRHDLYFSTILGTNLTRISENLDIINYEFTKDNTELFITYQEIDSLRDEYKNNKFAVYNFKMRKLTLLKSIDKTIIEINSILNKNITN